MELLKDIWRPLIVAAGIEEIARRGSLEGFALHWLPESGALAYTADPFGFWHEGVLHVFFEHFDYRTAHGTIGVHVLDAAMRVVETRIVLREAWHLSYPAVFAWEGDLWMLPEACGSGTATLYRAVDFPFRWEPAVRLALDAVPIDATPLRWQDRWWLFYAPAGTPAERLTHLHAAWADRLEGPWTPHPANPLVVDPQGARPAGLPFVLDGKLVLPIQDCRLSYGSGLRLLTIDTLDESRFSAQSGPLVGPPSGAGAYGAGCHTLVAAGPVTLVDVKRRIFSFEALSLRPRREWRRWRQGRVAMRGTMTGDVR
jgi:hypothetical protein